MKRLILILATFFIISIALFGCADDRMVIVIENSRTDVDTTAEYLDSETAEQTDAPKIADTTMPDDTDIGEIHSYVLNKNTKKFHYLSCSSVTEMKEKNKEFYSGTRDELLDSGFSPCGRCKP